MSDMVDQLRDRARDCVVVIHPGRAPGGTDVGGLDAILGAAADELERLEREAGAIRFAATALAEALPKPGSLSYPRYYLREQLDALRAALYPLNPAITSEVPANARDVSGGPLPPTSTNSENPKITSEPK